MPTTAGFTYSRATREAGSSLVASHSWVRCPSRRLSGAPGPPFLWAPSPDPRRCCSADLEVWADASQRADQESGATLSRAPTETAQMVELYKAGRCRKTLRRGWTEARGRYGTTCSARVDVTLFTDPP